MSLLDAARDSYLFRIHMEAREICEKDGRTTLEDLEAVEYSLRFREYWKSIQDVMRMKGRLMSLTPQPVLVNGNGKIVETYPSHSEDVKCILDLCDEQIRWWQDYYFGER